MEKRSQLICCLSSKQHIWFWHYHLGYVNNARAVWVSELINRINFRKIAGPNNRLHSSNFEPDNKSSNADVNNKSTAINKAMTNNLEYIKQLYKVYIKSKHIRIVKSKKITPTIKRPQEIYTDL